MERASRWGANQFTFVHESHRDSPDVIESFLGPLDEGEPLAFVWFDQADWSDVAVSIGLFPSKSQARKNGWSGELPGGLSHRQQKKGKFVKRDVWVLNEFDLAHTSV